MSIIKDKFTTKFIDISGKEFNIKERLNYNCIYYIKCVKSDNSSGYEGYCIVGKMYIHKINEPFTDKDYIPVWISLKKIAEGIFEATDEFIIGVKYVSVECINDNFTINFNEKLTKKYINVTFGNKNFITSTNDKFTMKKDELEKTEQIEERLKALQVLNEHFRNTSRIVHLEDEQVRLVLDAMIEFRQLGVIKSVCIDCKEEFKSTERCIACENNKVFPM